jgi:hypothetical protein
MWSILGRLLLKWEAFSQSMSKAGSIPLSYTFGIVDFDSVNNFAKGDFQQQGGFQFGTSETSHCASQDQSFG